MNRAELLRHFIEEGGNKVTCGFIWNGKDSLAVKLTQAASELRNKLLEEGKTVVYHKEATPSESWYSIELIEAKRQTFQVCWEKNGQGEFLDFVRER